MLIQTLHTLKRVTTTSIFVLALSACDTSNLLNLSETDVNENGITVTGSVGDGPITGANITVLDANGTTLDTAESTSNADYSAIVPENTAYPVVITSKGGIDTVTNKAPDFDMKTVMLSSLNKTANINPFSTMIVETAETMPGGITKENIDIATDYVFNNFNFGLDKALVPSPISTEITSENVAEIIKASEAFGEALRRTQTVLMQAGTTIYIGNIIKSLATDISDGKLDGSGNSASSKIAATFTVTSSKVLLETIKNELVVNGNVATLALDAAIQLTMPSFTSVTTADVKINEGILSQANIAVTATNALNPNSELPALLTALANIIPNSLSSDVSLPISNELDLALQDAVDTLDTADETQLSTVNTVVADAVEVPVSTVNPGETLSISATMPSSYQWSTLQIGGNVFIDREVTYDSIPSQFVGLDVLQTANDDKTSSGNSFISFDTNVSTVVYVAHDVRIATKLDWLSSWSDTGLILDAGDTSRQIYSKNFAPGTVTLGGNGGGDDSSMYTVIVEDPKGSSTTPNNNTSTLTANADIIPADSATPTNFNVLQNDTGLDDTPITLTITSQPIVGSVTVEANNTVTYNPDGATIGAFSFIYQIKNNNGDMATANVAINISCASCANNVDLALTWNANPDVESVNGYKVFYRVNAEAGSKLLSDIPNAQSGFDPTNPSKDYNAGSDMGLVSGDDVCFSIQAYNYAGSSTSSTEVCAKI